MLTAEQLDMRQNMMNASDSGSILNIHPYTSYSDKWNEKKFGKAKFMTHQMQEGHDIEQSARDIFFKETGIYMAECETLVDPDRSWQGATPDGIDFRRTVTLEIKRNNKKTHELAKQGNLPNYYMSQVQQQIHVARVEEGFYMSNLVEKGIIIDSAIVEVKKDSSFFEFLTEEEYKFWLSLKNDFPLKAPDLKDQISKFDCMKGVPIQMNSLEWEMLVDEWNMITDLEERKKEIKAKMIEMTGGKTAEGYGLKIQQVTQKGSVDYSLIPELRGVDLEKYRKQPTTFWRVS